MHRIYGHFKINRNSCLDTVLKPATPSAKPNSHPTTGHELPERCDNADGRFLLTISGK